MQQTEYMEGALSTESVIEKVIANKTELTYVLGAFVTITEMMDCLKKKIYYGKDKKYNENFHDLAKQLEYFTQCSDRHHDIAESVELPVDPRLFHSILGIGTEAGELGSALLKGINGEEVDKVNIMEEIGDILWYIAIGLDTTGFDFSHSFAANNKKLVSGDKARYKSGKFTQEEADARNLAAERESLEQSYAERDIERD